MSDSNCKIDKLKQQSQEKGQWAADCLQLLAGFSLDGPGVTRLPFTPEHRQANAQLQTWMEEAGMQVHMDAAGTLIGHLQADEPDAKTLLMGSHQDSVRHGGAFDGIMGIVLVIAVVRILRANNITLPFNLECLAFADEEGVRFPTALMGPRALSGTFDPAALTLRDQTGLTLEQAMRDFGLQPEHIPELKRDSSGLLGFIETHIEQGPVLEHETQALGVVTSICGIERHQVTIYGQAAHAGTMPMHLRQDALVAASHVITELENLANDTPSVNATVGAMHVFPNAPNAVPGKVEMTVEIRSPEDATREQCGQRITEFTRQLCHQRHLKLDIERTYFQQAKPCNANFQAQLQEAIIASGGQGMKLPSGATHDASAMADLTPMAMLFVRCRKGVSHNPAEFAEARDMGQAIEVLVRFLCG